jgi:arsenical pump membrane protein
MMGVVLAVGLLVAAVAGVFVHPRRVPASAAPLAAALLVVVLGVSTLGDAGHAVRPLVAPLLFLLLAVPLAVLLDRLGFFTAAAAMVSGGRHLHLGLWFFGAAVTTLFNLDAAVVLLTPLYIQIARRHGIDPIELAIQPAMLAALASSALPVSNLTNLIADQHLHLDALAFLGHLGPASLGAVIVGYLGYRRTRAGAIGEPQPDEPIDRRALRRGAPVVAFVLVGFTVGDLIGVPAFVVALVAVVWLLVLVDDRRRLPMPWDAAALALGLGVVAAAAAPHLGVDHLLSGHGVWGDAQAMGVAAVGADLVNNLPAWLVALPSLEAGSGRVWPVLLAVNMAPALVLTGALSGLLWRDTARRLGVEVTALDYTRRGVRIALPALLVAAALVLFVH